MKVLTVGRETTCFLTDRSDLSLRSHHNLLIAEKSFFFTKSKEITENSNDNN